MDNEHALVLSEDASATLRDYGIVGNEAGVGTDPWFDGTADAMQNWWGHTSGPRHRVSNPEGQGDYAYPDVLVDNWLQVDNCSVDTVVGIVGAAGGTVSSRSGKTTVSLSPGAVTTQTLVSLKIQNPAAIGTRPTPPGGQRAMRLFNVSAKRVSDGARVAPWRNRPPLPSTTRGRVLSWRSHPWGCTTSALVRIPVGKHPSCGR